MNVFFILYILLVFMILTLFLEIFKSVLSLKKLQIQKKEINASQLGGIK